jgi:MoxR-like ATPase
VTTTPPPPPPPPPLPPPPPTDLPGAATQWRSAPPTAPRDERLARTSDVAREIITEVEKSVVGKRDILELVLCGLLAGGHVLLDDLPGVAKTLIARSIATAGGLDYARIQFTPDLLPSDVTGATTLDLETNAPVFRAGPVFAQLILADEINRAPAKTQAALLEAMQEHQVTVDGRSRALPEPFLVIATQNPVESEGTYPLPEAQLDRFILRTKVGYPSTDDEFELVRRRLERGQDEVRLRAVTNATQFRAMQESLEHVEVDERIIRYVVAIVTATRRANDLAVGASPRGALALVKLARSRALLSGRDFVTPDDVRHIVVPALAHRVVLSAEAWARNAKPENLLLSAIDSVPAPSWR